MMNKVKCSFCGREYETEKLSVYCACGQRARLVLRKCRVCGVEYFLSYRSAICRPCSIEQKKTVIQWICRCGHEFRAQDAWNAKCPLCRKKTSRRKKVCSVCGAEFFGSATVKQCQSCADKQRLKSRFAHVPAGRAKHSEDQLKAMELCKRAPEEVHCFIWAEIYRRPAVAERIAKEAKTAPQAQEIINEANQKYYRQRSSVGVASYG